METNKSTLRTTLLAGTALLANLTAGCTESDPAAVAQAAMLDASSATVTYRYLDSSIPPPGHRSYTLLVDAESAVLTFDAYGEILGEQMQTTDIERLDDVLNRLSMSDLPDVTDQGCVGGPSYTLEVADASDSVLRRIFITPCDSDDAAVTELRTIIEPVLETFDLSRP